MGATDAKDVSASKKSSPLSGPTSPNAGDLQPPKNLSTEDLPDDSTLQDEEHDSDTKPNVPMQKRRRVTRACDECRRKKIKCDGKQPCTHCTVYSYGEPVHSQGSPRVWCNTEELIKPCARMYVRSTFQSKAKSGTAIHRSP